MNALGGATLSHVLILYVSTPSVDAANHIAELLIDKKLAACVNVMPSSTAIYRWAGKVERATEALMFVKTTNAKSSAARALIAQEHEYDVPCILALPTLPNQSNPGYLDWVQQETTG